MSVNGKNTPRKNKPVAPHASDGATILLVDDEISVRNLVTRFLTMSGFKILAAESAHAAQMVWAEHKNQIDLLLTDVVMPGGMSGPDLAEKLQEEHPMLRVLFTSGYNVELLYAEGCLESGIHFVQKPYRPDQLLAAVRAVLENNPVPSLC